MANRSFICLLWLSLCLGLVRNAPAQPRLVLTVSASSPVVVSNALVYTLVISNATTGGLVNSLNDVTVTDNLPSSVTLLAVSGGLATNVTGNVVVISNGVLNTLQMITNRITVRPTTQGTISNFVTVRAVDSLLQPVVATDSIVVTVSNAPRALLEGVISAKPQNVYVNDRINFSISMTNTGTAASQDTGVSNRFSEDVIVRSPSLPSPTNTLLLSAGSLAPMASATLTFVIQPTNAGPLITTASFTGSNLDTNTPGQSGSISNFVSEPNTNQLVVTTNSQFFDPQTGLIRQTIQVMNVSTSDVSSVRVVVEGLGTNRLINAVGTNADNAFVVYGAPLAAGESIDLVLEYFGKPREFIPGLTFVAYDGNAPDPVVTGGTSLIIVRTQPLSNPARLLIEFQSEPGASYSIIYADNMSFTNAHMAQPAVIANADRTQWIDDGPPKTISRLSVATNRFYQVIKQ